MHLHKYVTNNIGCRNNDAISAAFDLCSRVIRLQKIINREIVDREKHTHAEDGHNQHQIVQWIVGSSTGEENQCQPAANDQRWYRIDFHNFSQTDLKQPQHMGWLLIERIGQKAVVTIHEQSLGKPSATVDRIHNNGKIRQPI